MTLLKLFLLLFIIIAAYTRADADNLDPFAFYNTDGVLQGMGPIFFAFTGFDAICNAAEEGRSRASVRGGWSLARGAGHGPHLQRGPASTPTHLASTHCRRRRPSSCLLPCF